MKHYSSPLIILILISFFFFYACPKAIEPPKPQASIAIDIGPWPLSYYYFSYWGYATYNQLDVTISESNGVGGNVSTVKLIFYKGGTIEAEETKTGRSFGAYGSIVVSFILDVWGTSMNDCRIDKIRVEVNGGDYNGYSFTKNYETSVTWGMNNLGTMIR